MLRKQRHGEGEDRRGDRQKLLAKLHAAVIGDADVVLNDLQRSPTSRSRRTGCIVAVSHRTLLDRKLALPCVQSGSSGGRVAATHLRSIHWFPKPHRYWLVARGPQQVADALQRSTRRARNVVGGKASVMMHVTACPRAVAVQRLVSEAMTALGDYHRSSIRHRCRRRHLDRRRRFRMKNRLHPIDGVSSSGSSRLPEMKYRSELV